MSVTARVLVHVRTTIEEMIGAITEVGLHKLLIDIEVQNLKMIIFTVDSLGSLRFQVLAVIKARRDSLYIQLLKDFLLSRQNTSQLRDTN